MNNINLLPFYIGQKVVCINSPDFWDLISMENNQPAPNKNDIVTVDEIFDCECGCKEIMIRLKEHPGPGGYSSLCFAPVQENFQSISLEKILENETYLISAS